MGRSFSGAKWRIVFIIIGVLALDVAGWAGCGRSLSVWELRSYLLSQF
ncbi:MAG: hypothetical protein F6J93_01025 [Oscillatoria sp. SIO1A7]|nr:hypothetical protein [Oscillatoria sp. SIO1A7]